jgi:tetratricopeptide (TPR) repeat protein
MIRTVVLILCTGLFGLAKLPMERAVSVTQAELHLRAVDFNPALRDQIGQFAFVAGLSGFRSLVADLLFIQAHVAWERTDWGRVLILFRQVTTLQPRSILFWDTAAWHMAWNASTAAANDPNQPRLALRVKAQRDYFALGKDFLERGIENNPDQPSLYEALARLYRDKYRDHQRASKYFGKAAALPGAPSYAKRFAAYELSYCQGQERAAYNRLRALYDLGENERLPTLVQLLKNLEIKLGIPFEQRIPNCERLIVN